MARVGGIQARPKPAEQKKEPHKWGGIEGAKAAEKEVLLKSFECRAAL